MDYQKIYDSLIEKRKKTPAKGYTENHHILPKSMGGSNDKSNLVSLTGREHWVAHLLLHKIHRLPQTAFACHMMAMMSEERGIPNIRNSHLYQKIRIECAKNIGHWTSKRGKANSQYGTMWICNLELKENKKITKGDEIPEGWIDGRNKWEKKKVEYKRICQNCNKDFISNRNHIKYCSKKCILENKIKKSKDVKKMIIREYENAQKSGTFESKLKFYEDNVKDKYKVSQRFFYYALRGMG